MRLGIMQPYFLPYLGYYQLVSAVDAFVVYDNVQFVKKGWIHRNRYLQSGEPAMFSLPLASGSDFLDIGQRQLAPGFHLEREKILRRLEAAYRAAPFFRSTMPVIRECMASADAGLFGFLKHSLVTMLAYLEIRTPLIVSSSVDPEPVLRGQERVLDICRRVGASHYINSPGGRALYDAAAFRAAGLRLSFLQPKLVSYPQLGGVFVPNLSVVDVLMFNDLDDVRSQLTAFALEPGVGA